MTTDRALELAEAALHEKRHSYGRMSRNYLQEIDDALREISALRLALPDMGRLHAS
jgi:hypothetical protein